MLKDISLLCQDLQYSILYVGSPEYQKLFALETPQRAGDSKLLSQVKPNQIMSSIAIQQDFVHTRFRMSLTDLRIRTDYEKYNKAFFKNEFDYAQSQKAFREEQPRDFVSHLRNMQEQAEEYANGAILQRIVEISADYPFYRNSRGDGNCFYRSVIYQYIELLIVVNNLDKLGNLINQVNAVNAPLKKIPAFYAKYVKSRNLDELLIENFKKLEKNQNLEIPYQLYKLNQLFNYDETFDLSFQLLIRKLAYIQLKQKNPDLEPYFSGNEEELALTYGNEVEGVLLSIVSQILQADIVVTTLAKEDIPLQ